MYLTVSGLWFFLKKLKATALVVGFSCFQSVSFSYYFVRCENDWIFISDVMGLLFVNAALQNARYWGLNSTPDFPVFDNGSLTTFFVFSSL